ncbi:MAG: adenosylcobinamide amidohydrolase [Candidatus Bathyarchaeota archaeon]|nr:adenosylcobinamide amidohydrolase [Candidatus Bathyarchaeum tardum]WGM89988.1 MAG: adenosylcobinamide amidohydrolase [Candidatus Bathyarchaeum tardum]WNZ29873.1 MAG: adenosylcobinamide amidohydrolase [Candidatus Bathyarchaeota archaeon]
MKLETNIDSFEAEIQENKLILKSKFPLKILSSAVLNGGTQKANCIINVQVSEDTGSDVDDKVHRDARDFLLDEITKAGIPQDNVVAIMTAARMTNVEVVSEKFQDLTLTTFVTAGAYFAATPGDEIASKQVAFPPKKWGTINTIIVVDGNLTESCMVNAIVSATEAKAAALRELDVRSRFSGEVATGTVTDSVVIACTKHGNTIKYAGSGTIIGELIGKSVKVALKSAIFKQENMYSNRSLTRRLEERGVTVENLTILFSQIRPILRNNLEKREQFIKEFKQVLADQNIAALVIAALRLDEDVKTNLIPEGKNNEETDDFVLHKILQKAVTDYLSKQEAEFKFVRPDYLSSTFSDEMGWFTRSVLSAVMHCVYLNTLEKQKD